MNNDKTNQHSYFTSPLAFLADYKPEQLFAIWQQQEWAIWLDSSNGEHVDSNVDIMVFSPEVTLKSSIDNTKIFWPKRDKLHVSHDDPLTLVQSLMKKVFANGIQTNHELPFCGGAVGYFSYDLGRHYERLPATSIIDIALPDMAIGIYRSAIIFDRKLKTYTLVTHDNNIDQLTHDIQNKLNELIINPKSSPASFELQTEWRANMTKQQYGEKFTQIQEYLLSGDCYQINLAQRFSALYQGDEYQAYLKLRDANKAPFSAFMRIEEGTVLSVSPERFLQLKQQKVQSKPIKGTRPRSTIAEFDLEQSQQLQNSSKDRAENLMIVDLLRNDISKVCRPGSVNVPSLFAIESFPAVHHLVSTVEGTLDNHFNASDLLRGAFPGGSITGAPKIRAMEIIEELEPHRRSVYCGSVGYISACGNMDTSITIRTLICENDKIHCWAGGGIVADSKVDSEYQETFDKVNKILPVLT